MLNPYLEAGRIVATHGIKGEIKIDVWCDSPEFLKKFRTLYYKKGPEYIPVKVLSSRVHKSQLLALLEGIGSIEEGDAVRGRTLYIARADAHLPKGRYFIADLIGMEVYDHDSGRFYGKVSEVFNTGANDVYRITKNGKDYYFPAVDHMLGDKDFDSGKMTVKPIKGIFEDED